MRDNKHQSSFVLVGTHLISLFFEALEKFKLNSTGTFT